MTLHHSRRKNTPPTPPYRPRSAAAMRRDVFTYHAAPALRLIIHNEPARQAVPGRKRHALPCAGRSSSRRGRAPNARPRAPTVYLAHGRRTAVSGRTIQQAAALSSRTGCVDASMSRRQARRRARRCAAAHTPWRGRYGVPCYFYLSSSSAKPAHYFLGQLYRANARHLLPSRARMARQYMPTLPPLRPTRTAGDAMACLKWLTQPGSALLHDANIYCRITTT